MDIRALCSQAMIPLELGGRDRWGHAYEADELRFGFAFGQHALCFRYRTCEGSSGWFVNVRSPEDKQTFLVFTRIGEADVAQTLLFYIGRSQRIPPRTVIAPTCFSEQFPLFGS